MSNGYHILPWEREVWGNRARNQHRRNARFTMMYRATMATKLTGPVLWTKKGLVPHPEPNGGWK